MRKVQKVQWVAGLVGLVVSAAAVASPWSLTVGVGSALAANAQSGGQTAIDTVGAACGCTVTGHADTRVPFGSVGVGYRVNRWVAVAASGFAAGTFQDSMTLTGGGQSAPATLRDHISGGDLLLQIHHRFSRRWAWSAGAGLAVTRDSESGAITVGGSTATFPAVVNTRVSAAVSVAVTYALTRRWGLGLSYVEIPTVGSSGGQYTAGPLGLASVTGAYRF